ncbi:MAG: helix-turn-helix domain-containing protein [Actinobacteria bacterium]|nr:helix-turn-helix domain-containing protein [Actinomycetota bacterium]
MGLSAQDRVELQAAVGSGSYDGSVSSRAQIVLWYDEGYRKTEIAAMSGASRPTVDKWLARYERFGLEGLVSMNSPGGPRQIPDQVRAKVLALTRTTPPSALGISHLVLYGDGPVYQEDRGCVCVADVGVAAVAGERLEAVAAGDVQDFPGSAL